MATLNVTEFTGGGPHGGARPAGKMPIVTVQRITFTTATQSSAFNADTNLVRLISSAECYVLIDTDPTATVTTALRMIADSAEYFNVLPGQKVSVYDGTS